MSSLSLEMFSSFMADLNGDVVKYWNFTRKFPIDKQRKFLITFDRLLGTLNPVKAIYLMREVATGVELEVLNDINDSLQNGGKIADGCANWFSDFIVQGLSLGEESNSLRQAVKAAVENMRISGLQIFSPFIKVIYPMTLTFAGLSLTSYLAQKLLPLLNKKIEKMHSVPFELQVFKAIAFFNNNILPFLLLFIVVGIIGLFFYLKNGVGERRNNLDLYFPFYEYRQIQSILFMRLFSMLKKYNMSDMAIFNSMLKKQSDLYMLHHINKMIGGIKEGNSIGQAIDTGLINRTDIITLKVLSEAQEGKFVEAMEGTIEGTTESLLQRFEIIANILKFVFMIFGFCILADMGTVIFSIDKYVI